MSDTGKNAGQSSSLKVPVEVPMTYRQRLSSLFRVSLFPFLGFRGSSRHIPRCSLPIRAQIAKICTAKFNPWLGPRQLFNGKETK